MRYRRFGRTELQMPVFSCGGMRLQTSWNAKARVDPDGQRNLETTLGRALAHGIRHIETARGYGTSEVQYGRALRAFRRDRFWLQTKVPPRADPQQFARELDASFARLQVERLDLFAFHGINDERHLRFTLDCYPVVDRLVRAGRIGHVGFSTHGPCALIVRAIETGLFSYVNLHWYFIFRENRPAIAAAAARDLGVFIISPTDKGGHLHTPREPMRSDCAPLSPMQFNDLYCLANPAVHTLSVGAARPEEFDAHLAVLDRLDQAAEVCAPAAEKLDGRWRAALADLFGDMRAGDHYLDGIPEWDALPGGVNVRKILWLLGLCRAWDLVPYARARYALLSKDDHWFPGNNAATFDEPALRAALAGSPYAARVPALLREAHALLAEATP